MHEDVYFATFITKQTEFDSRVSFTISVFNFTRGHFQTTQTKAKFNCKNFKSRVLHDAGMTPGTGDENFIPHLNVLFS